MEIYGNLDRFAILIQPGEWYRRISNNDCLSNFAQFNVHQRGIELWAFKQHYENPLFTDHDLLHLEHVLLCVPNF